MALTFPLSLAAFADLLPIAALSPRQGLQQQLSSQASGSTIAADLAPAQREYDVTLIALPHEDAASIMALIEALRGPLNSFYIYDPRLVYLYPKADPTGSLLGAATPQINTVNANNKALSLKGLPAGYVITRGDFISWDYASSPARRAFFRVVETVTANGSGVISEFQISDFVQPGTSPNIFVTLIKPAMKAKLIAGSVKESVDSGNTMFTSISFSVRRVI